MILEFKGEVRIRDISWESSAYGIVSTQLPFIKLNI